MPSAAARARTAKLGLSAARLGPPSGRGRRGDAEAAAILAFASASGLRWLDAGRDAAEVVVGRVLPPASGFQLCVKAALLETGGVEAVERQARASLARLGAATADALVVRASDLLGADGGALWARVRALRDAGLFRRIGVSARAADEPASLARRYKPDLMQLPASLLDQRLIQSGALSEVAAQGVEVHLRSIFLDGLIFLPRDGLPPSLAEAGPRLSRIRRAIAEAGADPLQASLAFALGRPEASAVMVGVASCAELRAVVAAAAAPAPPSLDWRSLALDDPRALDGALWNRAA